LKAAKIINAFTERRLSRAGVALVVLIFSIAIELWVRHCGFLMTPDSFNYISAAKSFKATGVFLSPDGTHFTNWPPLFPVVLSFFEDPAAALSWIYLFCKLILAAFIFLLAEELLQKPFTKIIYLTTVFLEVHLLLISVFFWSEIIFMMLLLAHVYFSLHEKRNGYYGLLLLSGFLLCVQRNAGLFWIVSTSAWMMTDHTVLPGRRLTRSVLYVVICSSGLWFWHFYNVFYLQAREAFYRRAFFEGSFHNMELMLSSLGQAFFPVRGFLAEGAGALFTGVLIFLGRKYIQMKRSHALFALCLVVYTAGFVPIPNLDIHDMERYFAVVFPIFLLFPLLLVERFVAAYPNRVVLVHVCLVLWLVYPVLRMTKNAMQWREMSCSTSGVK
jgi:hypothetical protein